jgi:hypothetical protein
MIPTKNEKGDTKNNATAFEAIEVRPPIHNKIAEKIRHKMRRKNK